MYITADQVGCYDRPNQPPTYDPPLEARCPMCGVALTDDDVRTISLMPVGGVRSYFYRTHRTCHALADEADRQALDALAFAAVEAVWPAEEGTDG